MRLSSYTELIINLPYLDQSFETTKDVWSREAYASSKLFNSFYQLTFQQETKTLSRNDLFNVAEGNIHNALLSIILWGYPRNMRGNNFEKVLQHLENNDIPLYHNAEFAAADFFKLASTTFNRTGIGLSTLTKFLYFLRATINGYKCLILDSRIIEVLQSGLYQELTSLKTINESNKVKRYPQYLELMAETADKYGYLVDQLELFLFMFGRNLKSSIG